MFFPDKLHNCQLEMAICQIYSNIPKIHLDSGLFGDKIVQLAQNSIKLNFQEASRSFRKYILQRQRIG